MECRPAVGCRVDMQLADFVQYLWSCKFLYNQPLQTSYAFGRELIFVSSNGYNIHFRIKAKRAFMTLLKLNAAAAITTLIESP